MANKEINLYDPQQDQRYMSQEMLEYFKKLLQAKHNLLKEQLGSLIEDIHESNDSSEMNEIAAIGGHQLESVVTGELLQKQVHDIEHALNKITKGTYGYCEENGEVIGVRRLLAYPEARYCLEVQQQEEAREKG